MKEKSIVHKRERKKMVGLGEPFVFSALAFACDLSS